MCFFFQNKIEREKLIQQYQAALRKEFKQASYNGFLFPEALVITDKERAVLQTYTWGLIPYWAKDKSIREYTLNARVESLHEKPSFRDVITNRCIIPATGFNEWQWLDSKGKKKQKYFITVKDVELFSFAGLYSQWIDHGNGEILDTFTIITQPANTLMEEIHNSKKRMPAILSNPTEENAWLSGEMSQFENPNLVAAKEIQEGSNLTLDLFN
ncbi:SOS response-associated peptidase [bacterium]|nr:MAG: SOS response-associated peptidase [bacterium]